MSLKPKAKGALLLRRASGFIRVLTHNRRASVGIGILVFFTFVALFPSLLTPYDPIIQREKIATDKTYPTWLKYLPGYENTSENLFPIQDPKFSQATALQEWAFTPSPANQNLTLRYVPDVGSSNDTRPGCIAIDFQRSKDEPAQEVKATLTKEFYYPYKSPPKRYIGQIYLKADGVKNVSTWGVEARVFIQTDTEKRYVWTARQGGNNSGDWIAPDIFGSTIRYLPKIDSNIIDQLVTAFSKQTNYVYGVEVTFNREVQNATVFIDDLDLRLYGSAFGLLGTDDIGRDIFTQLVYGTRISLIVGLLAAFISVTLGLVVGLVSAYMGKFIDEALMRFTDMLLVLPELALLMVIIAVLGPSIWYIILLLGILGWMGFARTVRSQALSLKERPFVEAAKAVGAGRIHIIMRHILPNVMNLVYVTLAMTVPAAIMGEAYLSFLGLYDPSIMTWGRMFHEALDLPQGAQRWWWVIPPGFAIALISITFVLVGYALDEILNPQLRQRH